MTGEQRIYDGCSDHDTPAGTHIFSVAPASPEAEEEARQFVKDRQFTQDEVKICRCYGGISVITKKDILL